MFLKVIHRRRRTGFEETKDFPIRINDLIAGRYQVVLGDHALPYLVLCHKLIIQAFNTISFAFS